MFEVSKKGVSIYLALMIMFILLAIGLGISVIIVSQMRMIGEMGYSVVAFYTADTGIERILYEAKICYQDGCPSPPCCSSLGDTTCDSPCRPDCLGLLDNQLFPGNLDSDINYEAIHEICPDLNGDGVVDIMEAGIISAHWGDTCESDDWNPKVDLNGDGVVDIMETGIISAHWGEHCSGYNYFKSSGEFKETKRAIEVVR